MTTDSFATFFRGLVALCACICCAALVQAQTTKQNFNIPAGDAKAALKAFAEQSHAEMLASDKAIAGVKTNAVSGEMTASEALSRLLADTGLVADYNTKSNAVAVRRETPTESKNVNRAIAESSARPAEKSDVVRSEDGAVKLDTFEVFGKKTLNMDIQRTVDDPRPYVVYGAEEIQNSQASNLEEFLRARLPMNSSSQYGQGSQSQQTVRATSRSSFNLRGLGENQTLVLVDGRRMPGVVPLGNDLAQPDINGIPVAAIERVEILAASASSIYGGNAVGGVINVILKRNYVGVDLRLTYGSPFDTDASIARVDLSGGFQIARTGTGVSFSISRTEGTALQLGDRDFMQRSRALTFANNPTYYTSSLNPPTSALTNIRSINGSNLILDNGTPLNSPFTFVPTGYRGATSDGGAALASNAGKYSLSPSNDVTAGGLRQSLLATPSIASYGLNIRQEFGPQVQAYLDLSSLSNKGSYKGSGGISVTNLPADASNNPFTTPIRATLSNGPVDEINTEVSTLRASTGLIVRLPGKWTSALDYSWGRSRSELSGAVGNIINNTALQAAYNNGTLNPLVDLNQYPINFSSYVLPEPLYVGGPWDNIMRDASLRVGGPFLNLPAGRITLNSLLEYRTEEMPGAIADQDNGSGTARTYSYAPPRDLVAKSAYVEALIPLVSQAMNIPLVRQLDLQPSVRYDDYRTRAISTQAIVSIPSRDGPFPTPTYYVNKVHSTDFGAALKYTPFPDFVLRASFSTGFLPPGLSQLGTFRIGPLPFSFGNDPRRGNGPVGSAAAPLTELANGNPNLLPEDSKSISYGAIFTPKAIDGLRFSIDYTQIKKTDEIISPSLDFILANEASFPGRIVRGPNLPGDQAGWPGPVTLADVTYINIAHTTVRALDFQISYNREMKEWGKLEFYAVATRQLEFERQLLPASARIDSVGFIDGPLLWRANMGVNWNRGPWTVGWNIQYYYNYSVANSQNTAAGNAVYLNSQGSSRIPSQIYHDFLIKYRTGKSPRIATDWLKNIEISFGVQNVFNTEPPTLAEPLSALGYSQYADPRMRRFTLSVKKSI